MDWNSAPMACLLLFGFLAVLVSSRHHPNEFRAHNQPKLSLLDRLGLPEPSSEDNVKGLSSWTAVGTGTSTPPQLISGLSSKSRVQRPDTMGVLASLSSESGQLSPAVPLVWSSSSDHPSLFRSPGTSSSATSESAPSGVVELAVTKMAPKSRTSSIAVASASGPVAQISTIKSSSPSSLESRQSADGFMSNETSRTERYANPVTFLADLDSYRSKANTSIALGEPTTSESNISGLTRQPVGTSPALTIIAASPAETKDPTPAQAATTQQRQPPMEGPVMVWSPPTLSSDTTEASTSLYLTLAPGDLGSAISTATLDPGASITLASAEVSSPGIPELPELVTLHSRETEAFATPSEQAESETPPLEGTLPSLKKDTNLLSDATVSSLGSGLRDSSSPSTSLTPSPTLNSSSLPPSSSLPLPSPSMLVLSTTQSTTSGILRDPSVPTFTSASNESSNNTSSSQFSHLTVHQEGPELTTTGSTRGPSSGSSLITASLTPGENTSGLEVISDTTSMSNSSPSSLVSLGNSSSISSASSFSTTPTTPTIRPYLSWSHYSMTQSMDSVWSPTSVGTGLSKPSASSPAQNPLLMDSSLPSSGYNHITRPLTFRITNELFTDAFYDPTSLEYRLLSENVQSQLTPIYQRAFSSFDRVEVNGFRLGSVVVNTTIVFRNKTRAPSPMDIVWVLYREVKGVGMMLGNLSLAENSIQSEASTLTTLAPLTVHVSLTTMEPFVSSLLRPGSATYITLEGQTMGPVTPVVLGFYGMHPQQRPLLLFSNDDQWVGVTIVYKFNVPIPADLRGLADRLAREVTDTHIQKSSISVNEEKAELTIYNLWLRIPNWPFTEALKDKASRESRELRGRLTRGLTTILKPTQNFAEVIVEEFLPSPMTARVRPTYFSTAPSETDVQEWVSQGLGFLKDAEGLSVELASLDLPSSKPPVLPKAPFPSYAVAMIVLGLLLLLVVPLVLVLALKTNVCSQIAGLCIWKPRYGRQVTASEYTMHSYDLKH